MSLVFLTLSKKYSANRWSLYFNEKELELEYKIYLAKQTINPFLVTAAIVPFWCIALVVLFRFTGYWDVNVIPNIFYLPIIPMFWGIFSFFLARQIYLNQSLLGYLEGLCVVSIFVYLGLFILFLHGYMYTIMKENSRSYIEWLSCLTVSFTVCHRIRLIPCVFSIVVLIVADVIVSIVVEHVDHVILIDQRLAVMSTTLLTITIFIYQAEYTLRKTFLNEKENESWKIDVSDIHFGQLVGAGTFGEVIKGQYKGFTVAIKRISSKNIADSQEVDFKPLKATVWSAFSFISTASKHANRKSDIEVKTRQQRVFEKFEYEIRLMCTLRHPNIVTFMGACLRKPDMLLVTEFCELGSLFEFLVDPEYKPLELSLKIDFICGVCYGLQYLHQQNPPILHRDFKSLNILIDIHFNVKVCDFGLSDFAEPNISPGKRISQGSGTGSVKIKEKSQDDNKIVGTVPWVAPEIFSHKNHSEKSDLYSLGIVLWEIYSEKHPYSEDLEIEGLSVSKLVSKIINDNYRPRCKVKGSNIPIEVFELMKSLWHKNPLMRPSWSKIVLTLDFIKDPANRSRAETYLRGRSASDEEDRRPSKEVPGKDLLRKLGSAKRLSSKSSVGIESTHEEREMSTRRSSVDSDTSTKVEKKPSKSKIVADLKKPVSETSQDAKQRNLQVPKIGNNIKRSVDITFETDSNEE